MTRNLIIILNSSNDEIGMWGLIDNKKVIDHGQGKPPIAHNVYNTLLVLPGQFIRVYPHKVSIKSKRELAQAAIFSIENKIAEPITGLHFIVSEDRIAIINKDYLTRCLVKIKNMGFTPQRAAADFELFTSITGSFLILDRVINPGIFGNAIDSAWSEEKNIIDNIEIFKSIDHSVEKNNFLNLLQNEFAQKTASALPFKKLAFTGSLITCFVFVFISSIPIETRALKKQVSDLKLRTEKLYFDTTGEKANGKAALLTRKFISRGSSNSSDFLHLSEILFRSVDDVPGLSVSNIRFQNKDNELQIQFIYPSFESAGEIEKFVSEYGGILTTGGVREKSGILVGEASLREARS